MEEQTRIQTVLSQLTDIYPHSDTSIISTTSTVWAQDPWVKGSYSAYGPGQMTTLWPALRRPYGRLLFAGEHTDPYIGYIAVRSGQCVASILQNRQSLGLIN